MERKNAGSADRVVLRWERRASEQDVRRSLSRLEDVRGLLDDVANDWRRAESGQERGPQILTVSQGRLRDAVRKLSDLISMLDRSRSPGGFFRAAGERDDLQWGMKKLKEFIEGIKDTVDLWTARERPAEGISPEGNESLADAHGEVNLAVRELAGITAGLERVLRGLAKIKFPKRASIRLDPSVRRKVALAFKANHLDGNGKFKEPQDGFRKAVEIMAHFGIVLAEDVDSHRFSGNDGQFAVDIGTPNHESGMPPIPVKNAFVMSFHKREDENFEVLAYLS